MPIPPARMISVGLNDQRDHWHMKAHKHTHFELIVVAGGHEDVLVKGRRLTAGPGDMLMFKPGVVHEEWSLKSDPVRTYFVSFLWPGDAAGWPLMCVDGQGRVRLLSSWLFSCRDAAAPGSRAAEEAFFRALVLEFIRLCGAQDDPLVALVRGFVRRNIGAPLTVDMLAGEAGVSKFHFIRRYRGLTGRTPMEDVRLIRIGHARDMILTSSIPIKAVAAAAGLGDEVSLYRLFRRHLGMTPGELRRTVRG